MDGDRIKVSVYRSKFAGGRKGIDINMEGGGWSMELPEAVSLAGTIEGDRIIYIEDYVLQYLKVMCKERPIEEDKFALYGSRGNDAGKEVYIIYGIRSQKEQQCKQKKTNQGYEWIGNLEVEQEEDGEGSGKMFLTCKENDRHLMNGYYIFYDANDQMKERLGEYYEENVKRSRYKQITEKKAELVALSVDEQAEGISFYIWIRIAVAAILLIFCAIAVTTINEYNKMNDFVQAAVHTGEIIEESEKN